MYLAIEAQAIDAGKVNRARPRERGTRAGFGGREGDETCHDGMTSV